MLCCSMALFSSQSFAADGVNGLCRRVSAVALPRNGAAHPPPSAPDCGTAPAPETAHGCL